MKYIFYSLKITALILLVACVSDTNAMQRGHSQNPPGSGSWTAIPFNAPSHEKANYLNKTVSISATNVHLRTVLDKISSLAGVSFSYDGKNVPLEKSVDVNAQGVTVAEALNRTLAGTNLAWVAMGGNHIVITKANDPPKGSGEITGKVIDAQTKEGLPGATVLVKGTSVGASTDLDGNFIIHGVPAGEQTLVASYVGYKQFTKVVDVKASETLNEKIAMVATGVQGKTVVVTGQAQGQLQAINQQLSSDKIVSIVSSAKIQALPETNAASAIGKLPGISVQRSNGEADQITIRGIQPQYNEVAISNVPLASQGGSRAISLSTISPYMLKSIQVYKTLTPDMDADAIGGYVNMELRQAPRGFHSDLMWQSGYVSKNNTYDNYKVVASASNRFFNNAFGVYALVNAENYSANADNMSAAYNIVNGVPLPNGYEPVQVSTVTLDRHVEQRRRYGANLILDYSLPHGSITSTNMFSRFNSGGEDYSETLNYGSKSLNWNYTGFNNTQDLALNTLHWVNDFGLFSVSLQAANTYSLNRNPDQPSFNFYQTAGISGVAPYNTLPQDITHNIIFYQAGGADSSYLSNMNLTSSVYHENDQQVRLDIKVPVNIASAVSGYFKFGGEWRYNYRNNASDNPFINPVAGLVNNTAAVSNLASQFNIQYFKGTGEFPSSEFTSADSKLYASFLNNEFGAMYWVPKAGVLAAMANYLNATTSRNSLGWSGSVNGGWANGPDYWDPNRYTYIERYYAGYLMANFNVGPDFDIVGGARYEADYSHYDVHNLNASNNPIVQLTYPVSSLTRNMFLLPMVEARYEVNNWMDIRAAYSQTIARPNYNETSPEYHSAYTTVIGGNPNLRPPRSYNEDVEFDLHSNTLGLLSVDAFYKTVAHFDYGTYYQLYSHLPANLVAEGFDTTGQFTTPGLPGGMYLGTNINSPYNAYIKGVSLSLQTRLWYLPGFLDGIVLGANFTALNSVARYPVITSIPIARGVSVLHDSSRAARLIDQPNTILNTYLGYEYKGFSARVSLQYTGSYLAGVGTYTSQDSYTKGYLRLDAQVTQMLPWRGLQLYLDGENLNSEANVSAENAINGFTSEQYYGLTTYLGIRYTL